ncbi:MAG: ribonuclease D [Lachnospiraceae bacterium]|nr:ribonuclease D [Lachnospiraceae bacterium]
MDCVRRINLKTDCKNRNELISYCLGNEDEQYVVIGWSYVFDNKKDAFKDYKAFYYEVEKRVHEEGGRLNHALNSLWYVEEGDLFWTRDLAGFYWICRAKGSAVPYLDNDMDIGARVPVKAYRFGMDVPGQIKASFNRANGGIIEEIRDKLIINYSKYIYNDLAREDLYKDIEMVEGGIIDNLPDFDLEELVISYLQIKENYYVLSNSIANKSTTVGIECELISRDLNEPIKAVVQVKAKPDYIDYGAYKVYVDRGYKVYFYD